MTHNGSNLIGSLALAMILTTSLPLRAEGTKVQWNQVCEVAHDRDLTLSTKEGATVTGSCISIDVNEIAIRTKDRKIVRLSRTLLAGIQVEKTKSHHLKRLGRGLKDALAGEVAMVPTELGPVGIVAIPATLAWGVVAAPFCLFGDLLDQSSGRRELSIQP